MKKLLLPRIIKMLKQETGDDVNHYLQIAEHNKNLVDYVLANTLCTQTMVYCLLNASTENVVKSFVDHFDVSLFKTAITKRPDLVEWWIDSVCYLHCKTRVSDAFWNEIGAKLKFLTRAIGKEETVMFVENFYNSNKQTTQHLRDMTAEQHAKLIELINAV